MFMPARFSARSVANNGSSSMITGSPAVTVRLWIRASGVRPCSFSAALRDDQHRRGAVANLARRGGADHAVLLEQFDRADAFERGVEADALVDLVVTVCRRRVASTGTISAVERARLGRRLGALVAAQRIVIQLRARIAIFLGDHLGADELAEEGHAIFAG